MELSDHPWLGTSGGIRLMRTNKIYCTSRNIYRYAPSDALPVAAYILAALNGIMGASRFNGTKV